MQTSRDWMGEDDVDQESPLEIVKALPPGEVEGIFTNRDGSYSFQLVLNRRVNKLEAGAISANPFGLKLRAERKTIFVTDSTLEEIEKVGVELNNYVIEESKKALILNRAEREHRENANREREAEAAKLAEQARSIKFTD